MLPLGGGGDGGAEFGAFDGWGGGLLLLLLLLLLVLLFILVLLPLLLVVDMEGGLVLFNDADRFGFESGPLGSPLDLSSVGFLCMLTTPHCTT